MLAKYWSPPSVHGTVSISWFGREKADVGHYKFVTVPGWSSLKSVCDSESVAEFVALLGTP